MVFIVGLSDFCLLVESRRAQKSKVLPQKEYPARYHKKRIQIGSMKRESGQIPLDMGQETKAGCGGRGSNSGQDG